MKFSVLCIFVVTASAQLLSPEELNAVCGELDQQTCGSRALECLSFRRGAEDPSANLGFMQSCAEENGISRDDVSKALQAALSGQGKGEVLDNLSGIDEPRVNKLRLCVLQKKGLTGSTGNPDPDKIKTYLEKRLRTEMAAQPEALGTMLGALATCQAPTVITEAKQFRGCLLRECIKNFPTV